MTITAAEQNVGEAALKAFVQQAEGWEAEFVPESIYPEGATEIVNAADAAADQSETGRIAAGAAAIQNSITAAGYGSYITPELCEGASVSVLTAVETLRSETKS